MISSDTHATPVANASIYQDYGVSREGKRQAYILFAGVVSLWIFALWSLIVILDGGITGVEWVSSLLMMSMLVVAPVVGWSLLAEASSRYGMSEQGLKYSTVGGLSLLYSWEEIAGWAPRSGRGRIARFFLGDEPSGDATLSGDSSVVNSVDSEEDDEPETSLLQVSGVMPGGPAGLLHRLANGNNVLPIYGSIDNRDKLIGEITSRLGSR
ncbi:MAG: hypothetical protein M3014_11770 [Chloroflexota bacterium]|nr:hypothetical protein [Chloroflexota bacterium]